MEHPSYVLRRIDGATIELLPDGTLQVRPERGEQLTLTPELAHSLYLFFGLPGISPTLRRLDAERQRRAFEARY